MHTEFNFALSTVLGFLLVFTRVTGVFIYIPIPGVKAGPDTGRVALAVCTTLALFPLWPAPKEPDLPTLMGWLILEAGLGMAAGLVIAFFMDAFSFGAQMISLQSGFSYASTIDPNTDAESTVLVTISQLAAGMLFFAVGIDQQILTSFAKSLTSFPPGSFTLSQSMATQLMLVGSATFSTGLRLVLPALAFLLMVDIALALLSRVNSQLQVVALAFPVKILAAVLLLAALMVLLPRVFLKASQPALEAFRAVLRT